jgi:RNA polymerase sigma-70 factor (ECF subfamily)
MSSLAVAEDEAPTVDPNRFQATEDAYPGHWTVVGAPLVWEPGPEESAMAAEIRGLLASALGELPGRQRAVVTLRDVQGLTSDEVCEVLDLTPVNQRVLLHRGRARLRWALEEYYRGEQGTARRVS